MATYGASTVTIMDNLAYRPFGGAAAMDNGAGGIVGSVYNLGGKLMVSNPGAEHEMTYGYDKNGNLTSVDAPSTPWYNRVNETPTTYTYYPETNRLYQTITATETKNYFYDANGNITDIGNRVLTYNQNNRLVRVEEDSTVLGEYTYNGLGQRIIKHAGGVATVFHYDFDGNIIGESDTSGVFSKEYLYRGSNRLVLVDVTTGALYYYGNDQLGTPQILTDSTNTVVWEAVYKPYGEADVNPNSTVVNNFRFAGQYYDAETGMHENYHRYYDPGAGRYLTADPIGLTGGLNLYVYSDNNPIMFTDPFGLFKIRICLDSDKLQLFDDNGKELLDAGIVHGCEDTPTPTGKFKLGNWQQDKTSNRWGESSETPWSKSWWGGNVFGLYFVPVQGTGGVGIHGHRGPKLPGSFTAASLVSPCSHGCVRLSNYDIETMHGLMPKPAGTQVEIITNCK